MKVADVMSPQVEHVEVGETVEEVCGHIFGRGINGVPVCKGKKLVGFITERDILAKFYPSMQEYMEDTVHGSDFEAMEERVSEILALKASDVMSGDPTTVTPDTPLLRAQSLMAVRKVGRLPVVDGKDNLVGILSKGDIFRAIVGKRLPLGEEGKFYDWVSSYYDSIIDWKKRLSSEIPDIVTLFRREGVRSVLDIASGTGEHAIALAKRGFSVVGLESSRLMCEVAEAKRVKLLPQQKERATILNGSYKTLLRRISGADAAIFMGNTFPFVMVTDRTILQDVARTLNKNRSLFVFQLINFKKIFEAERGLRNFTMTKSQGVPHALFAFYTRDTGRTLSFSQAVFDRSGGKWVFRGIRSTPLLEVKKDHIVGQLERAGFSKFAFYGGSYNGPLFKEPFKPLESDLLNVVAKRG